MVQQWSICEYSPGGPGPGQRLRNHGLSSSRDRLLHEQISEYIVITYVYHVISDYTSALFKAVVSDNATLQTRVKELELDISGWKEAFKSADDERNLLAKEVSRLERNIGSLKVNIF